MSAPDQDRSHGGGAGARLGGGGREARRAQRREAILQAAMELIAERGYRRTSLAAVAERAGLTQQGLLHHFPTKQLLLVGVLEARDRWDLASAAAASGTLRTDALAQLVDYNATRSGIVQTYTVLSADSVTEDHPARAFFESRFRAVRASMAEVLRAEYGDTLPGGLSAERAAPLLAAVMDGLQLQWLLDPEEVDMPAAFRDFLALLGRTEGQGGGGSGEEPGVEPGVE
ncbi:transcriptional regulator, TetR family [Streptomyces sp. 2224.1]|uniref:TetR/AcrR family transcriptional regulator n=1 Tax=unclassified Streptomyces TaxID=2593676 RepID=UPI00088B4833|nr:MULTISPECIES: TetR/AcrR family transcriptional regulator [unclassified Streptomyces]PBC82232.1 TetR family transcriptional regulator [Streptomyces sp. 2321.6]SDR50762.1 transcriptional regulator, TetR family [Streptomyces sp. KS_16]SEC49139.1 transcriptional regulator, TetR family [Streptomyces sp. 2133.1]SEC54708.1 transcriptional regulator, TetR family [Streptomyces sp. 2224.1]SNC67840.1 DNA-binding transcriptional regulator, AcrR family [Streptomyces sp. 2114.4]